FARGQIVMIAAVIYGLILGFIGFGLLGAAHGTYWPLLVSVMATLLIGLNFAHAFSKDGRFFRTKATLLAVVTAIADWFVVDLYRTTPEQFQAAGLDTWMGFWFFWQFVFLVMIARCVYPDRFFPRRS